MTTDELKKEAEEWIAEYTGIDVETQRAIRLRYHDNLRNAYLASAEPREKRIAELEQENAELKTKVENQKSFLERIRAKFELGKLERKEIEGYLESDQLTKAKEILKAVVDFYPTTTATILCEAEQFLNSEVEK